MAPQINDKPRTLKIIIGILAGIALLLLTAHLIQLLISSDIQVTPVNVVYWLLLVSSLVLILLSKYKLFAIGIVAAALVSLLNLISVFVSHNISLAENPLSVLPSFLTLLLGGGVVFCLFRTTPAKMVAGVVLSALLCLLNLYSIITTLAMPLPILFFIELNIASLLISVCLLLSCIVSKQSPAAAFTQAPGTYCPLCHAFNEQHAVFCFKCGANLTGGGICPTCSSPLESNAKFCMNCGAKT